MTDAIRYGLWQIPGKTTMWIIVQEQSMLKLELNCYDWLEKMRSITKNRHDNDLINRTCVITEEYNTEQSKLIR